MAGKLLPRDIFNVLIEIKDLDYEDVSDLFSLVAMEKLGYKNDIEIAKEKIDGKRLRIFGEELRPEILKFFKDRVMINGD